MPTVPECVCCREIENVWNKVEEQQPEVSMNCITEHPGFRSTCLDVWVLETAYYAYKQQYGHAPQQDGNEYVYMIVYFLSYMNDYFRNSLR